MPNPTHLRIVYVVEGDVSIREGLSRLMDSLGLEARPCESVADFLERSKGTLAACVLLDICAVRQCEASARAALQAAAEVLPVIALSSSDDPAAQRLARACGAHSFFRKPVDAAALLDAIDWAMQVDAGRSPRHDH